MVRSEEVVTTFYKLNFINFAGKYAYDDGERAVWRKMIALL